MPSLDEILGDKKKGGKSLDDIIGKVDPYNAHFPATPVSAKVPLTGLAKEAASRKAGIGVQDTAAEYKQDVGSAKGEAAGRAAEAGVLGAGALASAPLSAPMAVGLMGAAGLASGAARETAKAQFGGDVPKNYMDLAKTLSWDTAFGAGGEGVARAVPGALKHLVSTSTEPGTLTSMMIESAAKSAKSKNRLDTIQQDVFSKIRGFAQDAGNPKLDLGKDMTNFFKRANEHVTGRSQAYEGAWKEVSGIMHKAGGGVIDQQPLDATMELKSVLNRYAYDTKSGLNGDERQAFKDLAASVDGHIERNLAKIGGAPALKMWNTYKGISEVANGYSVANELASSTIDKWLGKGAEYVPLKGALEGMTREHAAPWLLENLLISSERTEGLVKSAVAAQQAGNPKLASKMFETALNTSGLKSDLGILRKRIFEPPEPEKRPGNIGMVPGRDYKLSDVIGAFKE